MTKSNVDAIYLECPLEKNFPRHHVQDAYVEKWSQDFLDKQLVSGRYGDTYESWHPCFLLDAEGNIVSELGKYRKKVLFFFEVDAMRDDSVGQALVRLDEVLLKRVRYAVRPHYLLPSFTVYKPPRGYDNMADWHRSFIECERAKLRENAA